MLIWNCYYILPVPCIQLEKQVDEDIVTTILSLKTMQQFIFQKADTII